MGRSTIISNVKVKAFEELYLRKDPRKGDLELTSQGLTSWALGTLLPWTWANLVLTWAWASLGKSSLVLTWSCFALDLYQEKMAWLDPLQSQKNRRKIFRERAQGILGQTVASPGPQDALRQLKGRNKLWDYPKDICPLKKLYLYALWGKCCHKGCRRGLPPSRVPLQIKYSY